MVNADMFRNAIPTRDIKGAVNTLTNPQNTKPAPSQPPQYDPETEKLRKLMLKILTIIIGGAAALLIIWRVILKFL